MWSIPSILPVAREQAGAIREGEEIALVEPNGRAPAPMAVPIERYISIEPEKLEP